MFRIGNGYDVHRLKAGRKLILGGVEIPHDKGLDGHSDADVLVHSLADAILGACGARDIGAHFPDTDSKWKDVSSLLILKEVGKISASRGYAITNADTIIVAEKPKLAPHLPAMQMNIAAALGITAGQINIKATTTEQLGFAGREEGIAAYAVVLLNENNQH
jgi:2-C-methyl-D-erythritol 2,4-cyclodiphosphate synthase